MMIRSVGPIFNFSELERKSKEVQVPDSFVVFGKTLKMVLFLLMKTLELCTADIWA